MPVKIAPKFPDS